MPNPLPPYRTRPNPFATLTRTDDYPAPREGGHLRTLAEEEDAEIRAALRRDTLTRLGNEVWWAHTTMNPARLDHAIRRLEDMAEELTEHRKTLEP